MSLLEILIKVVQETVAVRSCLTLEYDGSMGVLSDRHVELLTLKWYYRDARVQVVRNLRGLDDRP